MTKIILLIILFNVVSAYLKNRAKKKKLEALLGGPKGAQGRDTVSTSGGDRVVSTSATEVAAKKREAPTWASRHDEDEVTQDLDEKTHSPDEDDEGENPFRESRKPQEINRPPQAGGKPESPAKEMGKDLLTQLARELGLEIPQTRPPAPQRPAPPSSSPSPAPSKPAPTLRNQRVTQSYGDNARTVADSAPGADLTSAPGIAAVESANAAAYATRDPRRPTALSGIREDLFERESLRRAFILKTILDKPLSLRHPSQSTRDSD